MLGLEGCSVNLGKENEQQEFKLGLAQLDKGLKSLSAMLNRQQKGTVYFGVDDDGTVKRGENGEKGPESAGQIPCSAG